MNARKQILAGLMIVAIAGCGTTQSKEGRGFFTSGSKEADQRADQRMAGVEQIRDTDKPALLAGDVQKSLYDRLGGEAGIKTIVDDFVNRMLADPRVNFDRTGVKKGGVLHRSKSVEWKPTDAGIEQLKKHIAQFLALSTGGPSFYDGKEMKQSHTGLHITNAEFDAAVGDLKATLDKVKIPDKEQRELLSIIESTRTQIVEER